MKKFTYILLILLTPILTLAGNSSWGNFNWPASRTYLTYSNERETITAPWTFTDTCYFAEATFEYAEVETLVVVYTSIEFAEIDSLKMGIGHEIQLDNDGDTYFYASVDDNVLFYVNAVMEAKLDTTGLTLTGLGFVTADTLTISSGSITPTLSNIVLKVESGSSDEITAIVGSNLPANAIIILRTSLSDDIILRDAGNFTLMGDRVLANVNDELVLQREGSTNTWREIAFANNGGTSLADVGMSGDSLSFRNYNMGNVGFEALIASTAWIDSLKRSMHLLADVGIWFIDDSTGWYSPADNSVWLKTAGTAALKVDNTLFNIIRDVQLDSNLLVNGETQLGDASTDTLDVYGMTNLRNNLYVYGETQLGDDATDTLDVWGLQNNRANQRIFNATAGLSIWDTDLETTGSADTSAINIEADGTPSFSMNGTDGDALNFTMNTSDQFLFQNASGGYVFDDDLLLAVNLGGDIGTAGTIVDSAFIDNLNVTTDIVNAGVLTNNGESFLGNELTDTTTVYRVQHKGSLMFDSLATGVKYIDFTLADNNSATTYWLYGNATNYWTSQGGFYAAGFSGTHYTATGYFAADDAAYSIGAASGGTPANAGQLLWETASAADGLLLTVPEGGVAPDLCGFGIGDSTAFNKVLTFFDPTTINDPFVYLLSDLCNGALVITGQSAADSMAVFSSVGVNKGFRFADDANFDSVVVIDISIIPDVAQGADAGTAALPFNLIFGDSIDANYADITDVITSMTIGGAYPYRAGGTDIPLLDGGTNASLTASNGGIVYSSATALGILAGTATANQIVMSGASTTPAWSTSTYPSTILQGDFLLGTNSSEVGKFAWTGAGNYIVSAADSLWTTVALLTDAVAGDGLGGGSDNVLLGADVDVTFTALLDSDGGLETVDDSINIKLDGVTLTLASTGLKVTDNTYQPLEATLTDIADGTIVEDLVNTANPWADNEVADNITASSYLPLAGGTVTADLILNDSLFFNANLAATISFDSILTFYSEVATPANGFVEFVRSDGSGAFTIGRTTATAPSTVAITDGGGDNEPGTIQLYTDGGTAVYLHARTDGRLRFESAAPVDDDVATNLILTYEDTTTLATKSDFTGYTQDSDTTTWLPSVTIAQGYVTGGTLAGSFTTLTLDASMGATDAFSGTATADTILNADFASTDIFSWSFTGAIGDSVKVLSYIAKTDTVIFVRQVDGDADQTYSWLRFK